MSGTADGPSDANTTISVVGVGNILYRDEGVGVYATRCLQEAYRFSPTIEVADGAALGFSLMDFFSDRSIVIVLDALLADAAPGTVYRLPTERLLDLGPAISPTAHEVDPILLLKRARALGQRTEMVLLGIVPADASEMRVGLTPALAAAFPRFVETVLSELRALGVRAERVREMSLGEVIEGLVTRAR
ncbi:MAG: hydrogenase maturation protease [Solirubrobacteraceae bacterium]